MIPPRGISSSNAKIMHNNNNNNPSNIGNSNTHSELSGLHYRYQSPSNNRVGSKSNSRSAHQSQTRPGLTISTNL